MPQTTSIRLFRPPVPPPREEALDLFDFLKAIRTNPLTSWTRDHFEHLIVAGDLARPCGTTWPRSSRMPLI
jgi:hypothetical protein